MNLATGQYWDITATAIRGCSRASEGCAHCWAERFAVRHAGNPKTKHLYEGLAADGRWTGRTRYVPGWDAKLQGMKTPKRVLFNCMGDLFHEHTSTRDICRALSDMASMKQHTFILPTKRTREAADLFTSINMATCRIKNLILLASVENQPRADERIPELLKCAPYVGAIGVSVEPMLGSIILTPYLAGPNGNAIKCGCGWRETEYGIVGATPAGEVCLACRQKPQRFSPVRWVICGGESGPHARPMHPDWARSLRDQCATANVPFMFKQWGEYRPATNKDLDMLDDSKISARAMPEEGPIHGETLLDKMANFYSHGVRFAKVGKTISGRLLDGVEHNDIVEVM